jgi:hypothetical protein
MKSQNATYRGFANAEHLCGLGVSHAFLVNSPNDSDADLLWMRIPGMHAHLRSDFTDHVNWVPV